MRYASIDALRGIAIALMIAYHFSFDLNLPWVRVLHQDFNNSAFWLTFRAIIVSLFLSLVGVSLVLAARAHVPPARAWRRIGLIALCATLVSAASYAMYPRSFIYFGILHCIALAIVLARPLVAHPRIALGAGIAVIALGLTVSIPAFDPRILNWIGFTTHKPITEDYVPLFPWLGVVLVGIALGHMLPARASTSLASIDARAPRALAWAGRHSLIIYMLHQPILIGILWLAFAR